VNKKLKTLAKILISIALFYLVFTKIDTNQIISIFKKSNPFFIALAFISFIVSQIISSFRLNYIFHKNDFTLTQISNLKLYFVGMFYNFFIPGGVGGDAYKVYILNKEFDWNVKSLTKCVFVDRLIGLFAIVFLMLIFGNAIFLNTNLSWFLILPILALFFFCSKFLLQKIIKDTSKIYNSSFVLSIIIQLFQITTVICLILGFGFNTIHIIQFCFVFLLSSILSVVSFAGFGSREYVFLQAASFLNTSDSNATSIALGFNIITAIVALLGILFIILKLNLKTINTN